jgi:hypothetical protein
MIVVCKKEICLQCATLHGREDETRFAESIAAPPGSLSLSADTRRNQQADSNGEEGRLEEPTLGIIREIIAMPW